MNEVQIVTNGFIRWNAKNAVTNIKQMEQIFIKESARDARRDDHNKN
jgi:hypothetical protein